MRALLTIAALLAFLFGTVACQQSRDIAGKYKATGDSGKDMQMQLFLKSDGKGSWKIRGEESPFVWELEGEEILLHSNTGGVITGRLDKDQSIHVAIPGMENLHFVRTER